MIGHRSTAFLGRPFLGIGVQHSWAHSWARQPASFMALPLEFPVCFPYVTMIAGSDVEESCTC